MLHTLWSNLSFRLMTVWTIVAILALGIWLSGLPMVVRFGLLGVLLVVQWRVIDRVTGLRGRAHRADNATGSKWRPPRP